MPDEYPDKHINEILEAVEYVESPVAKARMIHLAIETMIFKQKERIDKLESALGFARSVILSGEPWTETCDDIIGGAIPNVEST